MDKPEWPTPVPSGDQLIAAERMRQISEEGWTRLHDDGHEFEELARAAVCYAMPERDRQFDTLDISPEGWPWDSEWWKPCPDDRIRELVKAGALIAAEIDRLQRIKR